MQDTPKGIREESLSRISLQNALEEITALKQRLAQSEANLQTLQSELQQITRHAGHAIRIINRDYTIHYINQSFADMSGITTTEAIGQKCWEVFPSPFCHTPECRLARILNGETLIQAEIERSRRDGTRIPCIVNAVPFYSDDKHILGVIETFTDITEKKQLRKQAEESEERYRALIELGTEAGEAIVMLQDIDGREGIQTFVSDQWLQITGYSKEELLGNCFFDLVDAKDRPSSMERHHLKMAGRAVPGLYTMSIRHKNGNFIPIEVTGAFTTYQGKGANVLYIRDITARVQTEERLKHYQEHLEEIVCERTAQLSCEIERRQQAELKLEELYKKEQKLYQQVKKQLKERVEFTRALVHELKTPLTPMVAASSAMASGIQEEPWKSMAEQVHKGANNLSRRINNLLDLSKSELGILNLNFETVNPTLLLYDLYEYFSPEAARLGLSLALNIPEQLPSISADPERLRQVMINLLDNAIKFTPKHGQIKITAGVTNSNLLISVQDTGIGMTLKEQRRIFLPYERSEHDRNHLSGLGLGLALSKTFVEQYGGKIWIQSQKGQGSTFTFSIPLKRNLKQVIKR